MSARVKSDTLLVLIDKEALTTQWFDELGLRLSMERPMPFILDNGFHNLNKIYDNGYRDTTNLVLHPYFQSVNASNMNVSTFGGYACDDYAEHIEITPLP